MKKILFITLFLSIFAVNAFAASLSYSPASVYLTVPSGTEQAFPMTVSIADASFGTYYLTYIDTVGGGNLPKEWLVSSSAYSFLSRWWPTATSTITVSVPANTPAGTYSGYVISKAMSTHLYATSTEGIYVEITIPSRCSGKPTVLPISVDPPYLWPPNHKMRDVAITGRVTVPDGCSLYEAGYSIEDEYGIYSTTGEVAIGSGGAFSITLSLEASRDGNDKDGRHYNIRFYAEDEIGIGTGDTITVVVPHDQR